MVKLHHLLPFTLLATAQASFLKDSASAFVSLALDRAIQHTLRPNILSITSSLNTHLQSEILPQIVAAAVVDSGVDASKINQAAMVKSQAPKLKQQTKALEGELVKAFTKGIKNAGLVQTLVNVTPATPITTLAKTLKEQAIASTEAQVKPVVAAWYNSTVISIYKDVTKTITPTSATFQPRSEGARVLYGRQEQPKKELGDKILDVLNVATMLGIYALFFPVAIIAAPIAIIVGWITGQN
ncbi:hypothetical protein BC832DRAFT_549520 [Gaertneriomyces semiglobifer]|nr:hypothetical protein BC832DRAFT_549520 [Gaertneriomyces semiglobifer]